MLLPIAAVVAVMTILGIVAWSRKPPVTHQPSATRPAARPGAFSFSDPVHVLVVLAVGALVLVVLLF